MKRILLALPLADVLSCGGTEAPELTPPGEIGVDGVYSITACATASLQQQPVPCPVFISGSTQAQVDSGKLVVHKDRSAVWGFAQTWKRFDNCTGPESLTLVMGQDRSILLKRQ